MTQLAENTNDAAQKEEQIRNRLEINGTLILAIATLAITWCSYQSNLWSGIQTFRLARASMAYREAQEKTITAVQHQQMDEIAIVAFVQDFINGNEKSVDFFLRHAKPETATVIRSWISQDPLHNPKAPSHPMVTEEYKAIIKRNFSEVDSLRAKAEEHWQKAEYANTNSDNYVLFTVIFSMVMFLGAIATKMTHQKLSFGLIVGSGIICIIVLIILFFLMPLANE